jgi:phospholipid transport system substrate-binding protein
MGGGGRAYDPGRALVLIAVWLMLAASAVATADESPQALIRSVTDRVLDTLRTRGDEFDKDRGKLVALIEKEVAPYFDFSLISAQVLGRYWRTASDRQRSEFTAAFRQLLINTYAAVIGRYEGQTVEVTGAQAGVNPNRVMVTTLVESPGKPDVSIDYRLYRGGGDWLIYDVVADSVSLLINYRSEYSNVLAHTSMDSLIADLNAKNAKYASGGH